MNVHLQGQDCRPGCGACCTAPSISSPIPGMPDGKPAGVRCAQLLPDERCGIFGSPSGRPSAAGCGRRPRCAGQPGAGDALAGLAGAGNFRVCLSQCRARSPRMAIKKTGRQSPVLHRVQAAACPVRAAPARRGFHNAPPPPALLARGQAALGQRGAQFGFRTKPFQRLRQLRAVARILQDQRVLAADRYCAKPQ